MRTTRREFMKISAASVAGLTWASRLKAETGLNIRIGACDWSMQVTAQPEGFDVAKAIGLDGLEISCTDEARDELRIADPAFRDAYKAAMERTGLAVSSVAMGLLNSHPFATEERAPDWLEQTIRGTADLDSQVILLAFFGDGDLLQRRGLLGRGGGLKEAEVDATVERLVAAAPKAAEAGVILGLENTLSAAQNLAILDRVQHDAVQVYYDVGNSTYNGYDVAAEIRDLGDRMCQVHFKDGGNFLGEGRVDMDAVGQALRDIRYEGWIVLETAIRNNDRDASFAANAEYVRDMFNLA